MVIESQMCYFYSGRCLKFLSTNYKTINFDFMVKIYPKMRWVMEHFAKGDVYVVAED
jgi:collagenase-like PrtC family protease